MSCITKDNSLKIQTKRTVRNQNDDPLTFSITSIAGYMKEIELIAFSFEWLN